VQVSTLFTSARQEGVVMALHSYGVFAGRAVDDRIESGSKSPHFQIHVQGGGTDFRIAVNVLSQESPSELLYVADEAFAHPLLAGLPPLADGFTAVPSSPGGIALDFIRGNLFDRADMRPLPPNKPGPDNDLADKLEHYVRRAINESDARIYVFGDRWGPEEGVPDKIFDFSPGNGVHDVHMNQGNSLSFQKDDGVWQDGGLVLHYPSNDQWVAVFLAFQSQAWHTDDTTGHAISDSDSGDHSLRIVGALVNPVGPAPEQEFVTLINPGVTDINLSGWGLLDRLKQRMPLAADTIKAGETIRIQLKAPIQLGNGGGLITLLNPKDLKVDGVAYTKEQAQAEGETIVF
jgi:uncharacterized protein YukJ